MARLGHLAARGGREGVVLAKLGQRRERTMGRLGVPDERGDGDLFAGPCREYFEGALARQVGIATVLFVRRGGGTADACASRVLGLLHRLAIGRSQGLRSETEPEPVGCGV